MTTAAKYGAQDLNGNPVNYQQLVNPANTGPSNVIVNTTFVNRTGTANKARLALSSTALVPQTVSSTQGLYPITANQTNNAASLETQQVLTIGSTSSVTNAFTTAPITVTAATVGTNQLVCSSTVTLSVGQPVVFASPIGGLQANINYYVLNIVSSTNFTVSNVWNGAIVSLNGQTTNVLMYQSTANLSVGMPIQFHGAPFGGVAFNYNYYINTIPTNNSFTVTAVAGSGTAFSLTTNTFGTFAPFTALPLTGTSFNPTINNPAALNVSNVVSATYNGIQGLSINSTNSTGNVLSTAAITIYSMIPQNYASAPYNPSVILCSSTLTLTTGMPVVFSGTTGSVTGGVVYYVSQIFSSIAFNISATPGGTVLPLTSATPTTITMQQATTFLQVGQPIVFNGGGTFNSVTNNQTGNNGQVFGNLNINTPYYILTIPSSTTFTVSATPGGSAVTLLSDGMNGTIITAGSFKIGQRYVIVSTGNTTFTTIGATANTQGTVFVASGPGTGTGTAMVCTQYVTGGSLVTGVTYAIGYLGTVTATNINTAGGTTSGSISIQGVTSNYTSIGSFTTFANPTGSLAGGNQVVSYFVATTTTTNDGVFIPINPMITTTANHISNPLTIASSSAVTNAFTVAAIAVTATTASTGYITCASTATLAIGQPVVFDTSFSTIVAGTVYYVLTVQSSTTFQISATQITSTTPSNALYPLTTTTGQSVNMYQATTNLQVNVPMIFTGTAIGGVTSGQVYYVQNLLTTTVGSAVIANSFQISTIYGGPALALTTATGSMVATITPVVPTINVNASTASGSLTVGSTLGTYTNYLTTQYASCSATSGVAPYEITVNTTSWMSVGQPVVFSSVNTGTNVFAAGAIGSTNITAGTTYYIVSIDSLTSFQVSATYGGNPVALGATSQVMYVYQSTANLNIGQPVVFTSLTGTNTITNTNGTAVTVTAGSYSVGTQFTTGASITTTTGLAATTTYYVAAATTNSTTVTLATTYANALAGTAASFTSGAISNGGVTISGQTDPNISVNTTYYVNSVLGPAYFTIASSIYGSNVVVAGNGTLVSASALQIGPRPVMTISGTATSSGITMMTFPVTATQQYTNLITINTTYPLSVGMPVVFSAATGLMAANQLFYVASIVNGTQFTVSSIKGGTVYVQNTTTGISANLYQSTTNLYLNQPLVFFATQATQQVSANTTNSILAGNTSVPSGLGNMLYGVTLYINTFTSLISFTVSLSPNSSLPGSTAATTISLSTAGSTNSFAFIPMSNNVASNFAYQTAAVSVTATSSTAPYLITCTSTAGFAIGQPVQFDVAIGGLAINTTYYVLTIPSSTTFNISATPFGGVVVLTTATGGTGNVYQSTAGLTVGSAIQFTTASTYLGLPVDTYKNALNIASYQSVSAGLTFYVQSVPSFNTVVLTLINASPASFGASTSATAGGYGGIGMLPLGVGSYTGASIYSGSGNTLAVTGAAVPGAQSGAMYLNTISPVPPLVIGATTTTSNIITTQTINVSAVTSVGNLITCASTQYLFPGMPLVFSSSLGSGISSSTVYYVLTIPSATTFTVSTSFNGTVQAQSTTTANITAQQTTLFLQPNQPVIFYGTLGSTNLVAGTPYYINTVINSTSFTVSQYVNASIFALSTSAATNQFNAVTGPYRQYNISATAAAATPSFTLATFGLIGTQSTNGTNLVIANNTFALFPGMPISVSGTSGVLVASTIYYVVNIYDEHRFTVSIAPPAQYTSPNSVGYIPTTNSIVYQTPNGAVLPVTTQSSAVTLYQSAAKLQLNQPVIFYGNLGGMTVASNAMVIGRTYTIISVGNATFTSVGAAANTIGTVFTATATASGTTGVVYTGQINTNSVLLPNTVYYVSSATNAGVGANAITVSATPTYAGTNITSYITSVTIASPGVFSTSGLPFTLVAGQAITITGTAAATLATGSTAPNRTYYITNISGSTFSLETFPGNGAIQNTTSTSVSGWTFVLNGINPNISVNLQSAGSAALGLSTAGGTNAAMTMVPLMSNVTAPNVFQAQPLPIVSTSGSSAYTFTTGVMTVAYSTSIGSNLITCLSTAGLTVGMPVSFSATLGNISSATTYYVLSINSSTTFTVATTWGGQVLILTNAYNYSYVNASTANLYLGQPMVFTGSVFGGIIAYQTYYVATVPSTTTFTLANSLAAAIGVAGSSTAVQNTAATGYMLAYASTGSTTTTGAVVGGVNVGAFGSNPYGLVIGQQYMITSVGSTTWTTYGAATNTVGTIFTATAQGAAYGGGSFNIGVGTGTAVEIVGLVGNMNASIAANAPGMFAGPTITVTGINGTQLYTPGNTNYLSVGQAVVFTGYTFISGITAGLTYYIQSVVSSNVFTLSATSNGAALTFTTGSNTLSMQILNSIGTSLIPYQTYYTQSVPNPIAWSISSTNVQAPAITVSATASGTAITTGAYTVTAVSATGNLITTSSTAGLIVGQPVVFPTSVLGNIVATTIYYVQTVYSATQFSIATSATAQAFNPGTATGSVTMQIATANLAVGQQVNFSGNVGASGLVVGTNYYIQSLNANGYQFTLASLVGGTALSWTAATLSNGLIANFILNSTALTTSQVSTVSYQSNLLTLATGSSTQYLLPNQPVVFTNTAGANWSGLNTLLTVASATVPALSSAYVVTTVTTSSNVITLNYVTSNTAQRTATTLLTGAFPALTLNQPVVFIGSNVDNIVINQTYYVQSITAATGITVSTTPGGAAVSISSTTSPTAGTVLMIPAYYVKAVTSSNTLQLSATPGGATVNIPTFYAQGNNIVQMTPMPLNTDFIYGDVAVAAQSQVTANGILVPPNTYLYASAGLTVFGANVQSGINAIAIGVQDLV